jgi:hypothetical protein
MVVQSSLAFLVCITCVNSIFLGGGFSNCHGRNCTLSSLLRLAFVRWKFDVVPFKDGLALGVLGVTALIGRYQVLRVLFLELAIISIAAKSVLTFPAFACAIYSVQYFCSCRHLQ